MTTVQMRNKLKENINQKISVRSETREGPQVNFGWWFVAAGMNISNLSISQKELDYQAALQQRPCQCHVQARTGQAGQRTRNIHMVFD